MTECTKKYNKDKKIVSNYHRNESERLIWFISSTSKIILDCHTVGQKSEEASIPHDCGFYFIWNERSSKNPLLAKLAHGSGRKNWTACNTWNEGHSRLNSYLMFFIVYPQSRKPLQVLCLATSIISLP